MEKNGQGSASAVWSLSLPLSAYLVQAVRAAGKCDEVFKGFSNCLLKLGESVANYPQGLDDKTNVKTMCTPRQGLRRPRGRRSLEWAEEDHSAEAQSNTEACSSSALKPGRGAARAATNSPLFGAVFLSLCF
ncbi:neuritin isoform X3 [Myotis yumanensis]|uniref:neuritin isoform X3 n=1 Tax=Myotis yumanensis TaxID=159337 RepID=UPI0038D2433A